MQTTSSNFNQLAKGYVRPLSWGVRASFDKAKNPDVIFFTLDTSILDGTDILAPSDDIQIQPWDSYLYQDIDDRVISIEIVREETEPYSVVQSYADITLNNYDSYFTPNSGSPIQQYILPRRPFRALLGFGGEVLPQIVGLSDGMPTINKKARTAEFHIIDFMSYLFDQDISETVILQNVRTDEVLDYLFQLMGMVPIQYSLATGTNVISFFWVEKGTKFGEIANDLMEAEIGRLYMDEQGIIRFRSRYDYDVTSMYTFEKANTIDYSLNDQVKVVNSVRVLGDVRAVQPSQSIWTSSVVTLVDMNATVEVWADLQDPTTSITDPIYSPIEINDSYYTTALNQDGSGAYSGVTLTSTTLFSKSVKLVFYNGGDSPAYITAIDLYGTPAKIIESIVVEEKDQSSIDKFEEQPLEINNPYLQNRSTAQSMALTILNSYSEYGTGVDVDVKGNPALQLGDTVTLDLDGYQGPHIITKTTNIMSDRFIQRLRLREKKIVNFFTLDVSVLDGTDQLSP